tara:strand:+ start:374 stop:1174 length:801 start_codon:yes stop_codon:yes gene_type:complete
MKLTNKQIDQCIDLLGKTYNETQKSLWEKFESSDLNKELCMTKSQVFRLKRFNFTGLTIKNGKKTKYEFLDTFYEIFQFEDKIVDPVDYKRLKHALSSSVTTEWCLDTNSVIDFDENELRVWDKTGRQAFLKEMADKEASYSSSSDFYGGLFGIVMVIVIGSYVFGVINPTERTTQVSSSSQTISPLDQCISSSRAAQACSKDPVFTYCGTVEDQILGSGCTSRVTNAGSFIDQVKFCQAKVASAVKRQCAIQVYGCAAVTGDVDC